MKKILKKNQIVIYVIALMLVFAGYLNFTTKTHEQSVETSMQMEANDDMQVADIGDAELVSSNDVVTNESAGENIVENTSAENETINNVETSSNAGGDYFTKSKLERDTMYSQMLESYNKILDNSSISVDQKQIAQNEVKNINDTKNAIMITENLIKTKGFSDVVILKNGDSVNIIVQDEELEKDEIAQIQNIVAREMKAEIENIHISKK